MSAFDFVQFVFIVAIMLTLRSAGQRIKRLEGQVLDLDNTVNDLVSTKLDDLKIQKPKHRTMWPDNPITDHF